MTSILERLLPAADQVVCGRYRVRTELGRGGFGIVYRATHLSLDEDVAVKVLLPHLIENNQVAGRFEREVAVAKGLRHPNTIRVMDYGVTEQGLPFFVMELLQGRALEDIVDNDGPLSPARARRIICQVLKSLAEAHSHGIVHRDLKPGNIYLSQIVGEDDFVKVLDFGIAKALSGEDGGVHTTNTGVVLGTPAYMSPEQALGAKDLDGRSDLYAVGLILAECLTSQPLVVGDSAYVVVAQHASREPLALPAVVANSPLRPVIEKAITKDRHLRYSSASEMRAALEALGPLSEAISPGAYPVTDPRQPPPSLPHMTPVSLAGGRPYDPLAETISSGPHPQRFSSGPQGTGTEPLAAGSQTAAPKRRPWLVPVLLLTVAAAGAVAYAIAGGDGDAPAIDAQSPEGQSPEGQSPEGQLLAAPEGAAQGTGQAPDGAVGEAPGSPEPDGGSLVAALDPAAMERRFQVRTGVAIAQERLMGAVPLSRPVRFEGSGVTIRLGEQTFGPTPVELWLPRIQASIELGFERDGYRSEVRQVSLNDDTVNIELQRRGRGERPPQQPDDELPVDPHAQPNPEPEPPGPTTPFGQTPIHD